MKNHSAYVRKNLSIIFAIAPSELLETKSANTLHAARNPNNTIHFFLSNFLIQLYTIPKIIYNCNSVNIVHNAPFTEPVAKSFKQEGVYAIPNICVRSQIKILLSKSLYAKKHTIKKLTIVHTHNSGYIRSTRFAKNSFLFFDLSMDAETKKPLIENKMTTPGKNIDTLLIIFNNILSFTYGAVFQTKCPSITVIAAQYRIKSNALSLQ